MIYMKAKEKCRKLRNVSQRLVFDSGSNSLYCQVFFFVLIPSVDTVNQ